MNGIPQAELQQLKRIESHFDAAYVSLLTKLGYRYEAKQTIRRHEEEEEEEEEANSDKAEKAEEALETSEQVTQTIQQQPNKNELYENFSLQPTGDSEQQEVIENDEDYDDEDSDDEEDSDNEEEEASENYQKQSSERSSEMDESPDLTATIDDDEKSEIANSDRIWARKAEHKSRSSSNNNVRAEMIAIPLCFAKLMTKCLLATERAETLERQLIAAQRENCTLRAIGAAANGNNQNCAKKDRKKDAGKRNTKGQSGNAAAGAAISRMSSMIAFKAAIEQEIDRVIASQARKRRSLERRYKTRIFGLTIAVDYLRKELSGRVQQLQIYERIRDCAAAANSDRAVAAQQSRQLSQIWNQLIGEIVLHRHKTIVRLAENSLAAVEQDYEEEDEEMEEDSHLEDNLCALLSISGCPITGERSVDFTALGQLRFVTINIERKRQSDRGDDRHDEPIIGLLISGGAERRMPLVIERVIPSSIAARCGQLCPGDIILSIQNRDMIGATQRYAAKFLRSISGWCRLGIVRIPIRELDLRGAISGKVENFELLFHDFGSVNSSDEDLEIGDCGEKRRQQQQQQYRSEEMESEIISTASSSSSSSGDD